MKKKAVFFIAIFFISAVLAGIFFVSDKVFALISPPKAITYFAGMEPSGILLDSAITIKFSKPVRRQEIKYSIFPQVRGQWTFEDPLPPFGDHLFSALVFTPAVRFEPGTGYYVQIENIKGFGRDISSSFNFDFKTQAAGKESQAVLIGSQDEQKEKNVLLDIPLDWQDHSLSCEAASLKMALAGKGVFVSEEEIMAKIGFDSTSRRGNIWGDPNLSFVGDINGKICKTGFGVFREPVAAAGRAWQESEAFSNWGIEDLIREIQLKNPVIVWGVLPTGKLTDCSWFTPGGKYIKAFKETHVRLAVGFIGSPDNPEKIILNDPLAGRLYWPIPFFLENWGVYGDSGVVVR